ncbi:MAG: DUF1329 domain-containing protein [Deltaproteobacteria bacterium]|nr:DUF1329 domain-containing protein [Deltaproteobacteria bacterium]
MILKRADVKTLVLLLVLFLSLPRDLLAEEDNRSDDLSDKQRYLLESLPLPSSSERFFITNENVKAFSDFLLEPLDKWLASGKFVLRAGRQLNYEWKLSESWQKQTELGLGHFSVDRDGSLLCNLKETAESGFPFGSAVDINREQDPVIKAYQILWNSSYAETASQDMLYGFDLMLLSSREMLRKAEGMFYRRSFGRVYVESEPEHFEMPQASDAKEVKPVTRKQVKQASSLERGPQFSGTDDIFRQEAFKFLSPAAVSGFQHVSWRYRGFRGDSVWIYSPVIDRARRVFGSNRSDALIGMPITFDDFFTWSGKIQNVDAKVLDERILLVPFPHANLAVIENIKSLAEPLSQESALDESKKPTLEDLYAVHGLYQRVDGLYANMLWNNQTLRFLHSSAWIPTEAIFVPRKVWLLEVNPRDPFYASGRTVLAIDQESMLPIYKLVYSIGGALKRVIMGSWGLAASSSEANLRWPFVSFVLAVETESEQVSALTTTYVHSFLGKESVKAKSVRELLRVSVKAEQRGEE